MAYAPLKRWKSRRQRLKLHRAERAYAKAIPTRGVRPSTDARVPPRDEAVRSSPVAPSLRGAKMNVWTLPHADGWAVRREGSVRASRVFKTKAAAQAAGRRIAMRERVDHIIAAHDGRILERTSYSTGGPAGEVRGLA
jgi:hypothetical protein